MKAENIDRRSVLKGTAGVGALTLAGCIGSDDGDGNGDGGNGDGGNGDGGDDLSDVSMTIASAHEEGDINVEAARKFKDKIESETDESFSVEIVPGGAYGGESEMTELLGEGSIDGQASGSTMPILLWAPEYYITASPYVMDGYDHAVRVMNSDYFQTAWDQIAEDGGVIPMSKTRHIYRGMRNVTSNHAIRHPDDVEGFALRTPDIDPWVRIWDEIGADVTPVPLDELYSAIQTGVVDGTGADAAQALSTSLYEVNSHFNLTEQLVGGGALWINKDFYDGLDETYQELVIQFGEEATQEQTEEVNETEEEWFQELEDEGMTLVEDVDKDAFAEAARPAIEELFDEEWAGTWDEVREI